MKTDIARILIEQMISMIKLLFSLSTAICGGIMVLFLQILLHNSDPNKTTVILQYDWLLIVTFILEGLSILFGYLASGSIISLTPSIYKSVSPDIKNWTDISFTGSKMMRYHILLQFSFFGLGLIAVLFMVLMNQNQI